MTHLNGSRHVIDALALLPMNHVLGPRAALVRSLLLSQLETRTGNGRETGRRARREIGTGTGTENRRLDLSNTSGWTQRTLDAKHATKNDVERK